MIQLVAVLGVLCLWMETVVIAHIDPGILSSSSSSAAASSLLRQHQRASRRLGKKGKGKSSSRRRSPPANPPVSSPVTPPSIPPVAPPDRVEVTTPPVATPFAPFPSELVARLETSTPSSSLSPSPMPLRIPPLPTTQSPVPPSSLPTSGGLSSSNEPVMLPSPPPSSSSGSLGPTASSSRTSTYPTPVVSGPPSDWPSALPSLHPRSVPSTIPLDFPSLLPSNVPSVTPIVKTELTESTTPPSDTPQSPVVQDPNDSEWWTCPDSTLDRNGTIDGITTFPVSFQYQVWVEEDDVEMDVELVLTKVEKALTEAVADQLLTCTSSSARERRLLSNLIGISGQPLDQRAGSCNSECHRIDGVLTLQSTAGEGASPLDLSCAVVEVVSDTTTLTTLATSIGGVQAIRFQSSDLECGTPNTAGDIADEVVRGDPGSLAADPILEESSLSAGASVGIFVASAIFLVGLFGLARRRQESDQAQKEAHSFFIHPNNTMLSSPSSMCTGMASNKYGPLVDCPSMDEGDEDWSQEDVDLNDSFGPVSDLGMTQMVDVGEMEFKVSFQAHEKEAAIDATSDIEDDSQALESTMKVEADEREMEIEEKKNADIGKQAMESPEALEGDRETNDGVKETELLEVERENAEMNDAVEETVLLDSATADLLGANPASPSKWPSQEEPGSPEGEEEEDLESLIQAAEPIQLNKVKKRRRRRSRDEGSYRSCLASPPSLTPIKEDGRQSSESSTDETRKGNKEIQTSVPASMLHLGLEDWAAVSEASSASYLGSGDWIADSEQSSPCIIQIVEGDVQVLKLNDLEAAHLSDSEGSI